MVSCIGWQLGKAAMTDREAVTNQQLNTVIPNARVDADYLYYALSARRDELKRLGSVGTRTPIVNKSVFSGLRIPVPDLRLQQRIAGILSAYDDLIENCERRIRVLDDMVRTLHREWFVRFRYPGHETVPLVDAPLGPIPKGWAISRLDTALHFENGRPISKQQRQSGATLVYGANGVIGATHLPAMAERGVVMGKIGSCGALHRAREPLWVTNNGFLVRPALIRSEELLWQVLRSIDFAPYIGGAANPYLPVTAFGQHEILVPPEPVQAAFATRVASTDQLMGCLSDSIATLRKTRDLVLPRLLSGQLSVDDVL